MFRKIVLSIISVLSLFSACVYSVGLGDIKQSTGLNQPLNAVIPLLSSGDLAEYEVLASLASNKEFNKIGVERIFFLNSLKFETTRDDNDQIIIKVTTRTPVKEPFLNFVVELNWPNGRILREYTLLLDPPVFENSTVSTIEKSTSKPPTPWASNQGKPPAESRAPRSGYGDERNESTFSGNTYGPVSSTDTLWSISSRARPDNSVSIHQTLVAIYRANPDAFNDGNINNLRKGAVLNIPDASTIRSVPQRAALQDVVMQNRQWRSGSRKVVDRSGSRSSTSDSEQSGSRLSLATDNDQGDAQGYGSDTAELNKIRNELARSQEESATLQAENESLRSRLADIVSSAENTQTGSAVEIEDAELAALGQVSDDEDSDNLNSEVADTNSEIQDTDDSQNSSFEQQDNESTENNQLDSELATDLVSDNTESDNTGSDNTANEVVADTDEGAEKVPSIFKPKKPQGLLEKLLDSGALLWAGIVVVILGLMGLFWRMKRRMEDDEFQDDLVASAGAGSMDTTQAFELPDVGDDMLVELDMDNDDQAGGANSDESFDPLGEADIYIAYGKHEQAENLLLEAIEDNPVRADLKVKLMECYAESDSQEKFEELAIEVADSVDSQEWVGRVNELRTQAWGETEQGSAEEDDDFDLPSTEDIFGEDDGDELDLDFGESSPDDQSSTSDELDEINDLDDIEDIEGLDDLDDLDELSLDDKDSGSSSETDDDDFSLDMEDDNLSLDDSEDELSIDIDSDFDFDEDDDGEINFDESIGDEGDEIATKLDLARAYVDMGDTDGAKEILREVIAEGSDAQKTEAQELIDKTN